MGNPSRISADPPRSFRRVAVGLPPFKFSQTVTPDWDWQRGVSAVVTAKVEQAKRRLKELEAENAAAETSCR
jgi:hypothetical protein